jgi:hypothetical protein
MERRKSMHVNCIGEWGRRQPNPDQMEEIYLLGTHAKSKKVVEKLPTTHFSVIESMRDFIVNGQRER